MKRVAFAQLLSVDVFAPISPVEVWFLDLLAHLAMSITHSMIAPLPKLSVARKRAIALKDLANLCAEKCMA